MDCEGITEDLGGCPEGLEVRVEEEWVCVEGWDEGCAEVGERLLVV